MLFSYNLLKENIKGKLPKPEKLADILTMHSFEVEKIEKMGKDYILDIDVLPNRGGDCFSHMGMARECALLTKNKIKDQERNIKESKEKTTDYIKVNIENSNYCPRYTARVVTDVKVKESPKWMQDKLKVCGLRPINNIVDATNYVMLQTGQPLHAFDLDKLEAGQIIVRKAKKGEKIISLDDEKYTLNPDMLVIADSKDPLAIAGIKGGKKAEIDKNTKRVVIESANFDYRLIRRASKKINLRTDASWRFEHNLDPNLTEKGVDMAAIVVSELTTGKITKGRVDKYPRKIKPKKIKIDVNYISRLLGVEIPKTKVKQILTGLGFKVNNSFEVEIPTFRRDIEIPEDLVEEVGRIYGYENIPDVYPIGALVPPKRNYVHYWQNLIKDFMAGMGFSETYNYSFISDADLKIFNFKKVLELENPVSEESKYLRPSQIPNILKNIRDNLKYFAFLQTALKKEKEIRLFEIGKIFAKNSEKRMLTAAITGDKFYNLKGVTESLLNKLGISDVWYDEFEPTPEDSRISTWNKNRCAEIKVGNQEIGFLGEISTKILKDLKINEKVTVLDLDFDKLIRLSSEENEYQPISQYPAAVRDLAVLVPFATKVVDVLNIINAAGGKLVRDVDLFDVYEGQGVPEGKKNLAFHIVYQAENKTLTADEIDRLQEKIIKTLEENIDWQVRK